MPLYSYKCVRCHGVFDAQSTLATRNDARTCVDDACQQPAVRVPATSAFKLKGKGFHVNDYLKRGGRR